MYKSKLNVSETQQAIQALKDSFSLVMNHQLNLIKVPGPLFINCSDNLNDRLSDNVDGVKFQPSSVKEEQEIVQSLAKWKRVALKKYGYPLHSGISVDMRAIRRTEEVDAIHSLLVDQWDWEYIIDEKDYNTDMIKKVVNKIFYAMKSTEDYINISYRELEEKLPTEVFYITSKELYDMYPGKSAKEREYLITKEHKCVFILQIGGKIEGTANEVHDYRAKDYDNLMLNGDLLVYHKVNDIALELMSMGIRVDSKALIEQKELDVSKIDTFSDYYQMIIRNELPLTIGGGVGQSRLAMYLLEKAHIGEVQVSSWDADYVAKLEQENIHLL
ncbi:amino acid--tRNA ligase-related protein [Ureaplasma ceti]|uniref:Aspartate--ammonia ligase n=1 Tax=Ureaplasma ceti TaxID=3119530 RepID=A0ABP9U653_9BACT